MFIFCLIVGNCRLWFIVKLCQQFLDALIRTYESRIPLAFLFLNKNICKRNGKMSASDCYHLQMDF